MTRDRDHRRGEITYPLHILPCVSYLQFQWLSIPSNVFHFTTLYCIIVLNEIDLYIICWPPIEDNRKVPEMRMCV
jgi:hypothetical protein